MPKRVGSLLILGLFSFPAYSQEKGIQITLTSGEQYTEARIDSLDGTDVLVTSSGTHYRVPIDSIREISGGVSGQRDEAGTFAMMYGCMGGFFTGLAVVAIVDSGDVNWTIPIVLGAVGVGVGWLLSSPGDCNCVRFDSLTTTERDSILEVYLEGENQ